MLGKIAKVYNNIFEVLCSGETLSAQLSKKIKKQGVFTGDDVTIEIEPSTNQATILTLSPRKNSFPRVRAANIDQILLIISAKEPAVENLLIYKYLLMIHQNSLPVQLIFNKTDLLSATELSTIKTKFAEYSPVFSSIYKTENIELLKNILKKKSSLIIGPSGVGKSSLLNALSPELDLKTNKLTQIATGRHTTRNTSLFAVFEDSFVFDSPGFSEIPLTFTRTELAEFFFKDLPLECKFSNCSHLSEPNCAIKNAMKTNRLVNKNYQLYLDLLGET